MQLFIYVDAASGLGDSASRGPLTTGKAHLRPFLRMLSLKSTSRLEAAYTEEKQAATKRLYQSLCATRSLSQHVKITSQCAVMETPSCQNSKELSDGGGRR